MEAPRNIRTKAYVVQGKGKPFTLCDVVLDEIQPNEVLVEIWYTGICHTVRIAASFIVFKVC
jgi:Zn-dependent alcohol dehydrogenase